MRCYLGLALLTVACVDVPTLSASEIGDTRPGDEPSGEGPGEGPGEDSGDETDGGEDGGGSAGVDPDLPGDDPEDPPVLYSARGPELGVDLLHACMPNTFATPGQAWADIDRDGFLDLVLTNQLSPNRVFMGGPGGSFSVPSWADDLALAEKINSGAVFADVDNDGWTDLYILADGPNTLLRNLAGQGFVDVSEAAGIGDPGVGETAAFGDLDGDGWLDLYVANNDVASPDPLYRGVGDGAFVDASFLLELETHSRPSFSASFFDYDLDGDLDLYVVTDKQVGNVLWRNDGPGCGGWCLTDVSEAAGAAVTPFGMGLAVGDYDNDGDQDLFVTDIGPMILLQNQAAQGQPAFVEVSAEAGALVDTLGWGEVGWGAQFLDYDNDGWLDLYVALGKQDPGPQQPNIMLRNLGDGSFARRPDVAGAADAGRSFGLAVGDHDGDGWLDLLVGNSCQPYSLFHNGGGDAGVARHHLTVELRADAPGVSAEAIGARVYVHDDQGRTQVRELIAGSSLGAGTSARLHFGLGKARPTNVTVVWPDGLVDAHPDPPTDTRWVLDYPG